VKDALQHRIEKVSSYFLNSLSLHETITLKSVLCLLDYVPIADDPLSEGLL